MEAAADYQGMLHAPLHEGQQKLIANNPKDLCA